MIKAVFFDIDGTLVSFKTHQIPRSAVQALKQLHDRGIRIFVATGRGRDGLSVLDDIPFDGYITLNGQYCYVGDQVIEESFLNQEDLKVLLDKIAENPFPCGFTLEHDKIFNYRDERVDLIHEITKNDDHPAGDVSRVLKEKVYQCMAFISEDQERDLLSRMPHSISARWHPLFCDVTSKGGTKQKGIQTFLDYYGIKREETMSFGDGGNDEQMLDYTAVAVVMGNGSEDLKEKADYVTDTVENDGIAKALKHFGLIEEDYGSNQTHTR